MKKCKLLLKRVFLGTTYTIGKLFINDIYFCDTLEDTVRDYNKDGDLEDEGEKKIYGETAIPYGTYKVILTLSPKFKRILPLILGVKHFIGILMHSGTTSSDTLGCILVGKNTEKGKITSSRDTEKQLVKLLKEYTEIEIEII